MPSIKRIVFDAFDTIFDTTFVDQKILEVCGPHPDLVQIWRMKLVEYSWLRSMMNQYRPFSQIAADALNFALNHKKLLLSPEQWEDILEACRMLPMFAEVQPGLKQLGRYFQLGILSNADLALLEDLLTFNNCDDFGQNLHSADEVRIFNPDPRLYQLALGGGLAPSEIIFAATNPWDIAGAKAAGLQVAWIRRNDQIILDELGQQPDLIFKSLEHMVKTFLPAE